VLQHGSVLLDDDQSLMRDITIGPAATPDVQPLSRILRRRASWEEVTTAIANTARVWGDHWEGVADEQHLLGESEPLAVQFRDPAWTWQR
jgi:hypothetical protein